jgi:hypothetical protein
MIALAPGMSDYFVIRNGIARGAVQRLLFAKTRREHSNREKSTWNGSYFHANLDVKGTCDCFV